MTELLSDSELVQLYEDGELDDISTSYNLLRCQPATLTKASYYKNCFTLYGKIGPLYYRYHNNGVYRTGFDYEENNFTLGCIDGCIPEPGEDDPYCENDTLDISLKPISF